jgi:hypothetical protein
MLGNYGQSLKQYKKVLDSEPENGIALYYAYLNNLYLNNTAAARYYAGKLPDETKLAEKITPVKLSSVEAEYSFKSPTDTYRDYAYYARVGLNIHLGYKFELQQSGAFFSQQISEPALLYVMNNKYIKVNQKEYYAKLIFSPTGNLSLFGGTHYLYTPYNNFIYHNTIIFGGINYTTPFVHLKAMADFGHVTDSTYNQYDLTVSLFPLGNTRMYSITRAAYGDHFTVSQVAGCQIAKRLWLEANITIGKFKNLLENDALYMYNDIDRKELKAGGSVYTLLSKKLTLAINYTFEKKLKYNTLNQNFYQHSINTGLTWKL